MAGNGPFGSQYRYRLGVWRGILFVYDCPTYRLVARGELLAVVGSDIVASILYAVESSSRKAAAVTLHGLVAHCHT
jgi:hypothetical protein